MSTCAPPDRPPNPVCHVPSTNSQHFIDCHWSSLICSGILLAFHCQYWHYCKPNTRFYQTKFSFLFVLFAHYSLHQSIHQTSLWLVCQSIYRFPANIAIRWLQHCKLLKLLLTAIIANTTTTNINCLVWKPLQSTWYDQCQSLLLLVPSTVESDEQFTIDIG